MDYAYFGPAAEWPLVSTIASVAGIVLIFGQQAGQGARALAGLALDDLRQFLAWLVQPWLACIALLVVPLAFPASAWVLDLARRGADRVGDGTGQGRRLLRGIDPIVARPPEASARPSDRRAESRSPSRA